MKALRIFLYTLSPVVGVFGMLVAFSILWLLSKWFSNQEDLIYMFNQPVFDSSNATYFIMKFISLFGVLVIIPYITLIRKYVR